MRIVIDFGAIGYRIRRAWVTYCMPTLDKSRCWECGARLTVEEYTHYGQACERCEGLRFQRLEKAEREHFGDPVKATGIYAPRGVGSADCHCEECDPIRMEIDAAGHFHSPNMRMIVCATCGNKRCPHATDHRNPCTGSNEPGQPGSSYA